MVSVLRGTSEEQFDSGPVYMIVFLGEKAKVLFCFACPFTRGRIEMEQNDRIG